jgi:hypothetical protein
MFGQPVQIAGQQVYPCNLCSNTSAVVTVPETELQNHRAFHTPSPEHESSAATEAPAPSPSVEPSPPAEIDFAARAKAANASGPNWKVLIGLAVVVALAIVIAVVVKQTAKMSVDGTFAFSGSHSADCSTGTEGYDDINDTTQVTIGADGKVLAVTDLGAATVSDNECLYTFTLDGVSKNHSIYTVEVSHRGGISFTKAQVEAGGVGLTLG